MDAKEARVLVVDDDREFLKEFCDVLKDNDMTVRAATSADEAFRILQETPISVVLSDQRMPGTKGNDFLATVAKTHPRIVRVLITAYSDLEPAIDAINRAGIKSYIKKSDDPEKIVSVIRDALDYQRVLVDLEETRKKRARGPRELPDIESVHVAVVRESQSNYRSFFLFSNAFQMPVTYLKPNEFTAALYDPTKFHVIFADADDLSVEKMPVRSKAENQFPYVIVFSSDPKKILPHVKARGFYDCVDKKILNDTDAIAVYLFQLPAIGTVAFEKRSGDL